MSGIKLSKKYKNRNRSKSNTLDKIWYFGVIDKRRKYEMYRGRKQI